MTGKIKETLNETANMIFPSENFIVITHLLRWSIYITHKKVNLTDSTYPKSAPALRGMELREKEAQKY